MPNCFLEAKFCSSNSKNITEIIFFLEKTGFFPRFMPLHAQNAILTTLIKNRQKNEISFARPLKLDIQTTSFLKLYLLVGKHFRSHRLHVWKHCQWKFAESLKSCLHKKKYTFTEVFFSSGHVDIKIDITT